MNSSSILGTGYWGQYPNSNKNVKNASCDNYVVNNKTFNNVFNIHIMMTEHLIK